MQEEHRLNSANYDEVLMSLVEMALSRPPAERERYLREACAGSADLFSAAWSYVEREQRMNGFLLDPLFTSTQKEQLLQPGDLLHQRFRIVRAVAEGGMGVVYEAQDEKLDRRIAIKCAKLGFRKRLPPEVRHASEVSHPNICKIYEIHSAAMDGDQFDFLTMEFLEGETLADRLLRGPLEEEEARSIGRQLCDGLAEAHRNQVIHGDLKSSNVILTKRPEGGVRPVITDFGLASKSAAARFHPQSGEIAGTPDYMAPELLRGGKPSVASDLYALGVLLHELATGHRPISPDEPWESRLHLKPPPIRHRWNAILQQCLDPDPICRPAKASEIALVLDPPARMPLMIAAAVLIAIVAIAYGLWARRQGAPAQEQIRLAVLPFVAAGEMAPLAGNLVRETASQVARIRSSSKTKLTFVAGGGQMDLKTASQTLGVTHVVHGRLERQADKIVLHASITDARSQTSLRVWKTEYGVSEARFIPVALAGLVTREFGLPALPAPATVNPAASADYEKGLFHLRRNSGVDAALEALQRAVAADPDSPLTHAALAEAQRLKFISTDDRAWLQRAQASVREAERRNPDLAPVHRIAGLLLQDTGSYEAAAAEYRRAIELDPSSAVAHRRLGQVYERNNRMSDAVVAFRQAVETGPDDYRNYVSLGSHYYKRAEYAEAVKYFQGAVDRAPDEPGAHFALGTAHLDSGNYGAAELELLSAIRLGGGNNPEAVMNLALVLMFEGKDYDAVTRLAQLVERWPETYQGWLNLGIAQNRIGRAADAERAFRRSLELAEAEMARNPRDGKARSNLAFSCAKLRNSRRAESEIAQALQFSPAEADVLWMAAATYEALGQRDNALAVLSRAPPGVIASMSRWPDVADMSRDPRFQQLIPGNQIR